MKAPTKMILAKTATLSQASCNDNTFTENNFSANTFDFATNGSGGIALLLSSLRIFSKKHL